MEAPHDGGTVRGKHKAPMAIFNFLARSKRFYNKHASAPSQRDVGEDEVNSELLYNVDGSSDECSSASERSPSTTHTTSEWKTTMNMINFIIGVDYLAVPFAIKKGGISAVAALILVPVIYCYTSNVLIACLYDGVTNSDKTRLRSSLSELGDIVLPKYGGYLVKGFQQMDLWILAVSYLVVCGSLLHHALPSAPLTEAMWVALIGVIVLPAAFFNSLSQIAWLSVFSLLAVFAVVVSVVWHGVRNTASASWSVPSLLFWDADGGLVSVFIALYCYDSFGILTSAEKSMTDKNKFGRALHWAYFASTTLKVLFSVLAFLSFGVDTDEIILNNLPAGPLGITVSIASVLSCIFSFPLCLHPVLECLHQLECTSNASTKCSRFLVMVTVRVAVTGCTVATAIFLPHFALLVSFWGSLSVVLCMVIFPCIIHLRLNFRGLRLYKIFIDLLLIIFGVVAWVIGSVFTSKALFEALFTNKPEPKTNAH